MSIRRTAVWVDGRANLLLIVLFAGLVGGFAALWPAQITIEMPQEPSFGTPARAVDEREVGESPLLPTPLRVGSVSQHHPAGFPGGDNPWHDVGVSWALPGVRHVGTWYPAPTRISVVLTGSAPPPQPRGPPVSAAQR